MKIHHIGYLVDDIKVAVKEFEKLAFSRIGEIVEDSSRESYILFLNNGGHVVELIQPVSDTSPVYGLRKKYRNSPYHICYETGDLHSKIEKLVSLDDGGQYVLIQPPQPAPAIQGCPNVAFLINQHIGIIELVEILSNNAF